MSTTTGPAPLNVGQKLLLIASGLLLLLLIVSSMTNNAYENSPAGREAQATALARLLDEGHGFWQDVRQTDPQGALFVSYQITDGSVVWVTVTNQWFYLPSGQQDQIYDNLKREWGSFQGVSIGPVILVDETGRQLR